MKRTLLAAPLALLLVLATAASVRADAGVRDNAGFFSDSAIRRAEGTIAEIRQQYGKDLLVETLPSLPSDRAAQLDAQPRERVYSDLAADRAAANRVNGVYVLVTKQPSYLEAVVGNATVKRAFTTVNRDELARTMLASLKQRQNDAALLNGVDYVRRTMGQNLAGSASAVAPNTNSAVAQSQGRSYPGSAMPAPAPTRRGPGIGTFVLLILGVALMFGVVRFLTRRRNATMGTQYPPNQGIPPQGYDPRYHQPGYGQPGMGGYGGYGTGGGFGRGLLGGLLGGMAGGWMWDRLNRHDAPANHADPNAGNLSQGGGGMFGGSQETDTSYLGGSGGAFDDSPSDFGGGGDMGGGDSDNGSGGAF